MTEAQIWTIVTFTGVVFLAFLAYVGAEVRDNSKTLHEMSMSLLRHEFHFHRIEQRLDGHDARFDSVDARFDAVEAKLIEHDGRLDELKAIGDQLGGQFFTLAKKLDDHLRRHV